MSVRPVLPWPHPHLLAPSPEVPSFDDRHKAALLTLSRDMMDTVAAAGGVMLSAPQIGTRLRAIYLARELAGGPLFIVNPVISERGTLLRHEKESCMSTPGITIDVQRSAFVVVRGRRLNGDEITVPATGVLAQALQHEINHLDGKTIVECSKRAKRWWYREKLNKYGGAKGHALDYRDLRVAV